MTRKHRTRLDRTQRQRRIERLGRTQRQRRMERLGRFAALSLLAVAARPAAAQTSVFADEFNGSAIDTAQWTWFDTSWSLQRTQFGNAPVQGADSNGTRYARLRLDTYNPDPAQASSKMRGCEMISKRAFTMGSGLEMEARVRAPGLPRGLVGACFTYSERGTWPDSYLKEEIDYELISNQARNKLWLNIWNDWNPRYPYNDGAHNQDSNPTVSGLDWSQWTVFKIRWLNNRTEWYANNVLVRTDTSILPDDPQNLHFNLWAPEASWSTAYDSGIQPTSNPASNRPFYLDVDYVRVRTIAPPAGAVLGTGTGLNATYYDNNNFTGASLNRLDSRVYLNWGNYSPAPSIAPDTFSARWTGQVQAQYSQTYTFYTQSDDGVRLWVNGVKLIDNWTNHSVTENSGSIALTAGTKYNIVVEYYDNTGGAQIKLLWSSASTPKQPVPQSQLYIGDASAPTISISSPIAGYSYRNPVAARGSAADAGGVRQVALRLRRGTDGFYFNGSTWTSTQSQVLATGTTNWSYTMPTLPDGSYSFQAIATDFAGNSSTTMAFAFYVDTTAPTVAVTAPTTTFSYRAVASATGTARDTGPGVASVTCRLRRVADNTYWNGTGWGTTAVERPATGTTSWTFTLPALADGRYTLQGIARDYVGNAGASAIIEFIIDNVGPSILVSTPAANTLYASLGNATGTASDAGGGVAQVRGKLQRKSDNLYWNGTAWTTTATEVAASGLNTWTFRMPTLANGAYAFQAVARDYVGNSTSSAITNFSIGAGGLVRDSAPSGFSTGSASAATQTVTLVFNRVLEADAASDSSHYLVYVAGRPVTVEGVSYNSATRAVTLSLPAGTIQSGSDVIATWSGLSDAADNLLAKGNWRGAAQ